MGSSPTDLERGQSLERALAELLYDERARARLQQGALDEPLFATLDAAELGEAARALRRMILERSYRGSGDLATWFPQTVAAWRRDHPEDDSLDDLAARFCASEACRAWREGPAAEPGISLEEAYFRFFVSAEIGDPAIREEEFLGAIVRGLAVTPHAVFERPPAVRSAPGGCFALTQTGVLHAALDGRYLRGPVTPLIIALLDGEAVGALTRRLELSRAEIQSVQEEHRSMRLVG